jgi:hypothetical protein
MIHEHFNARRGDISQTGVAQANGEVGRPANSTGSKLLAFQKKQRGGGGGGGGGTGVSTTGRPTNTRIKNSRGGLEKRGGT